MVGGVRAEPEGETWELEGANSSISLVHLVSEASGIVKLDSIGQGSSLPDA